MKTKNPPKKLKLIKATLVHLNHGQMNSAQGGNTTTDPRTSFIILCTDSIMPDYTFDCQKDSYTMLNC